MADIPSPLTYATITGSTFAVGPDSGDVGFAPDISLPTGTVTLTPNVYIYKTTTGTPELMFLKPIVARVIAGQIYADDSGTPLRVLATDSPGIEPTGFQYTATFDLKNTGTPSNPSDVIFSAPGGSTVNLFALTSAAPAPPTSATYVLTSEMNAALALKSDIASPTFTGVPAAPTASAGTSTTQLATTAFVTTADNLKAPLASPTFTGVPAGPTAAAATSTTQLATTAFVTTADNLKAPLASPTFTGVPAAPTASTNTNTTQVATTAFVIAQILAEMLRGVPIVCKWVIGTGWRTLSGGAIPTDGARPLYYDQSEHDPATVTVTTPTLYSNYDKIFPFYTVT